MKGTDEKSQVINVVEDFDYSTQQESYNKCFIAWRKNKSNPFAYSFELNTKESVFIDGQGFTEKSHKEAEFEVLVKIIYIIGVALLVVTLVENVLDRLLVLLLDAVGVDIHGTFFNSVIYGGGTEIVMLLIVMTLLKFIVPAFLIHSKFKMPAKLRMPMQLSDPGELMASIAAVMIVCVVTGITSAYSQESKEIYAFFQTYDADVSVWGQGEFIVYTFFDIIVVSFLFEILFRGEMFQALRQFGDVYAVIVTSVLSGLVTQDYHIMLGTMMTSVVASIGLLRSGTIFTAILTRIVYKMYLLSQTIIEMNTSDNMFLTRNIFMICVFTAGLIMLGVMCLDKNRRTKKTFADCCTQLSLKSKLCMTLKVFPVFGVSLICLIAAAVRLCI